jgi:hypothetical protein
VTFVWGWENRKPYFTMYAVSISKPPDTGDVLTMEELLQTLAGTVSCGGNILINIGPTSQGTIPTIFQVYPAREPYQPSSRYTEPGNHTNHFPGIPSQGTIPTIFQVYPAKEPYQPSFRYSQPGNHTNHLPGIPSQGAIPTIFQVYPAREPYQPSFRYSQPGNHTNHLSGTRRMEDVCGYSLIVIYSS